MRWGLRVATDRRSGEGHIARCRALAAELGDSFILFCDPSGGTRARFDWAPEIVAEPAAESLAAATAALRNGEIGGLIVDSYSVGDKALAEAAACGVVAAFRDGERGGSETISIDSNPGASGGATVLAGPGYMPLPRQYAQRNAEARSRDSARLPSSILVAFGMHDSANLTMMALDGLSELLSRVTISVAVGPDAPHAAAVARRIAELPSARLLAANSVMDEVYPDFDLAIGAPGVSQFERACCGLPSILVAQNKRQQHLARAWVGTGAAVSSESRPAAISEALAAFFERPQTLRETRAHGLAVVDGRGAQRVAAALNDRVRARR